jgi:hypothetical protein
VRETLELWGGPDVCGGETRRHRGSRQLNDGGWVPTVARWQTEGLFVGGDVRSVCEVASLVGLFGV